MSGTTDPAAYRDDVPLRRVAVVVVCDVPAVTSQDAARIAQLTLLRALLVAPNRLRRGSSAHGSHPTLRHLVNDRLDDPRDVRVVAVEDLRFALRADRPLVALVPLGEPTPPPPPPPPDTEESS